MANPEISILLKARDEATKQLEGITGKIEGMSRTFKIAGAGMVAAGSAITGMLGMAVKAAAKEEVGIVKLSTAMKNMGLSYETVQGSLEQWIDTQQQKTAVADDEQRDALSQLIRMTGDLEEAQDKMTLAMDIAAGTGRDLAGANQMVMYAMGGNWGMVERYIPALKMATTEEEKWAKLREMFAGQAEAYGATMSGQMQLLKNNIGDVKEAIGGIIADAIAPLSKHLSNILPQVKAWIAEHPGLVKAITLATAAFGLILIPLGAFLIMLPMLIAGITTLTAVSSPWLLIIGAIILGLGALIAIGVLVYKNWDTICQWARKVRDWFVNLYQVIKEKVMVAIDWLRENWTKLLWMFGPLTGAIGLLIENWEDVVNVVGKVIDKFKQVSDCVGKVIGRSPGVVMLEEEVGKLGEVLPLKELEAFRKQGLVPMSEIVRELITRTDNFMDSLLGLTGSFLRLLREIPKIIDSLLVFADTILHNTELVDNLINRLEAIPSEITTTITTVERTISEGGGGEGRGGEGREGAGPGPAGPGPPGRGRVAPLPIEIGEVPLMQRGGYMPWTGPAWLHKGETVLPANTTITIPIYLDGELISEKVIERTSDIARLQGVRA